jgi:carboxymethylenebutenolidase
MAQAMLPRYAQAQTISFTDQRIKANYVTYPSPGGNSGSMRGYLVQPAGAGPFPAALGPDMHAGAPYYGVAAAAESVATIKAPLLCHLAERDDYINPTYPAFEAALKAAGVPCQVHVYPGTQHGFHNNSTPRYNEAALQRSRGQAVVGAHGRAFQEAPGMTGHGAGALQ